MKKFVRIGVLIAICGLIGGLIIWNVSNKPPITSEVWDAATTIGDPDTATRHYVQYSDLACPYCDVFSRLTIENEEEFKRYLADHKILFEIRMTDMIYDSTESQMSRDSAIATYCAKRDNKFVEYYHAAIMALYRDYHSKGIGDSKTSPHIDDMPNDYWLKIGHDLGLGESFDQCNKNKETLEEVVNNTQKAEKIAQGLPYFEFEKFATSGFDNKWGWEYVVKYLDAGLK